MRIRHKPWAQPELDACPFFIKDAYGMAEKWRSTFARPEAPLFVELGCGKGAFVAVEAARNPQFNFLEVDIKSEVLMLAKRAAEREFAVLERNTDNIEITAFDIERIASVMTVADPVDRLYINFPNPWPKPRHRKRRLTHPRALLHYRIFLRDGATVCFKTDDDELFHDSLEYFELCGYKLSRVSSDLYSESRPRGPMTEHEQMFTSRGLPIHYIEAVKLPDEVFALQKVENCAHFNDDRCDEKELRYIDAAKREIASACL